MSTLTPRVSVIMPVYNGELFLRAAIESILNQTYQNFEYIIIDDGSTDGSAEILRSFTDPRLKIITGTKNEGLPKALNTGLAIASGEYIARMDSDDISAPGRLAEQVQFLDTHPDIGVVGTWAEVFGGSSPYTWKNPTEPAAIKALLPFSCCLLHPTIMLRQSVLKDNAISYNEEFLSAQDYELWSRLWQKTEFANIPKTLLHYRVNEQSISQTKRATQLANTWRVHESFLTQLGIKITSDSSWLHTTTACPEGLSHLEFLRQKEAWFQAIIAANRTRRIMDTFALQKTIHSIWFATCFSGPFTWSRLETYWQSPLCVVDSTFFYKLWRMFGTLKLPVSK